MDTKFKPIGGIYVVTRRECLDRTFTTLATHHCLAIGQTADFASALLTDNDRSTLAKRGANCICVCAVADDARRLEIEKDLIEGNEQWGGQLHYLFRSDVPPSAPAVSDELKTAGG